MVTLLRCGILLAAFNLLGCTSDTEKAEAEPGTEPATYVSQIEQFRADKDKAFKLEATSPIPEPEKSAFSGLSYYPPDPGYRYTLSINKYDDQPAFKLVTSTGSVREAVKYGYFDFTMNGEPCSLQVYKLLEVQSRYPGYLFLPFTDATSGVETYGGGRYLDFQENEAGLYDVDFNLAYYPSCAYGKPGYDCPIPPAENRLRVAVHAGERGNQHAAH